MFSVPLNPKLNPSQFDTFLKFLKEHRDLIYDVYFTSRIPPFEFDAMGDVYKESQFDLLTENALIITKQTGIPLSATLNNIEVPPTMENLDLLIKNYKKLYDAGVKIVTIPHTLWMLTGKFQKAYPDVLIKNTILRNVQRPNEVVKCVEAGFHYINFDRANHTAEQAYTLAFIQGPVTTLLMIVPFIIFLGYSLSSSRHKEIINSLK